MSSINNGDDDYEMMIKKKNAARCLSRSTIATLLIHSTQVSEASTPRLLNSEAITSTRPFEPTNVFAPYRSWKSIEELYIR